MNLKSQRWWLHLKIQIKKHDVIYFKSHNQKIGMAFGEGNARTFHVEKAMVNRCQQRRPAKPHIHVIPCHPSRFTHKYFSIFTSSKQHTVKDKAENSIWEAWLLQFLRKQALSLIFECPVTFHHGKDPWYNSHCSSTCTLTPHYSISTQHIPPPASWGTLEFHLLVLAAVTTVATQNAKAHLLFFPTDQTILVSSSLGSELFSTATGNANALDFLQSAQHMDAVP